MSDEVTLTLPAEEDFRPIAHLVVGGLGVRLDLTYEELEDLQVALDALLGCRDDDGEVIVTVDVDDGTVRATVGPFGAPRARRARARRERARAPPRARDGVRRRSRSRSATAARGWS